MRLNLFTALIVLVSLAACKPQAAPKSMEQQFEERRPVGTWQGIGTTSDELGSRAYVVNTRTGTVCEYEFHDSRGKPGERFALSTCDIPPAPLQ